LADPTGGEQVFDQMMAEEQHELLSLQRGDCLKAAIGGPDSPACDGMNMGMEIQAVSVALDGEDDARQGA
jgi:hypothetical protein